MARGDDEVDPTDWLSGQFGSQPETEPVKKAKPVEDAPAPAPYSPPPLVPPAAPAPAPPAATGNGLPAAPGGGFSWGLTPSTSTSGEAAPPAAAPAPVTPAPAPVPPVAAPAAPAWDIPTVASPVVPGAPEPTRAMPLAPEPTQALDRTELVRQEFPGFSAPEPAPLDPALDGATELLGAQPVGLAGPVGESAEPSALDDLFGDAQFVEYTDELIPALPPRASTGLAVVERAPKPQRAPIPKVQKILMGVAGGLIAALALIALFMVGLRTGQSMPPPAAEPAPGVTDETPVVPAEGPLAPGDYNWQELRGGECLAPFESAWQDSYTVVDCSSAHPAQLVLIGTLPDAADVAYPGVEALQATVNPLCSAPTVIDYAATGDADDVQVTASFPANEEDWATGNRTFHCFVSRAEGATFDTSVVLAQPATVDEG